MVTVSVSHLSEEYTRPHQMEWVWYQAKVRDLPCRPVAVAFAHPNLFTPVPPTPTMAPTSHRVKGRDLALPTLDVLIQALNVAKDACGIPPAQIALSSAGTLLTMIRVRFPLLFGDELVIDVCPGHHVQPSGLYRPWEELRQCLSSTRPEIEGKANGRAQRGRSGCNWRSYYVS